MRQPRPRAPCSGGAKAKSLTEKNSSVARLADYSLYLKLGIFPAHECEKLVPRLLIVAKCAEHGAGDGLAMLLFHAAHLHAEMAGFDNHADAFRADFFLDHADAFRADFFL